MIVRLQDSLSLVQMVQWEEKNCQPPAYYLRLFESLKGDGAWMGLYSASKEARGQRKIKGAYAL
jgi:hypothetical protein